MKRARRSLDVPRKAICAVLAAAALCAALAPRAIAARHHPPHRTHAHHAEASSAKDIEIARLQSQVAELKYDLEQAQAKIDALETAPLAQSQGTPSAQHSAPAAQVSITDVAAQRYPGGDGMGDPMWVITFQFANNTQQAVAMPRVYVNCTDANIGTAVRYVGNRGLVVVDPPLINPTQNLHLKYAWVATTPTEQPATITIDLGASSIVVPVGTVETSP